jgi:flavin-dependent dehydrogenase
MYDVVIAGAGLAGLQTARLLAARGARVLLADPRNSVCERIRTTGIFVRKTWEDFPILDEQLGPAIRHVTLYSPARRPLQLAAAKPEFRVGRMDWIYLRLLDQCARHGVAWRPSTRVVASGPDGVVLERSRHRQTVRARFIVGADGARSAIARQLGLDQNSEFLAGVEDVVPSSSPDAPALHCFLDPRLAPGYMAWIVDDGQEAHVGVAGSGNRYHPAAALEAFKRSIAASFPSMMRKPLERRGGLIPVNGVLRRIGNERGLLVGDAAGAVSPLTAGGLDAAMRLSAFAADVIAQYLETGDPAVLREYSGHRFRPRFAARRFMRRAIQAIDHPLLAEIGCALLRTPPLRALAWHVFFSRSSFPDARIRWGAGACPERSRRALAAANRG